MLDPTIGFFNKNTKNTVPMSESFCLRRRQWWWSPCRDSL